MASIYVAVMKVVTLDKSAAAKVTDEIEQQGE